MFDIHHWPITEVPEASCQGPDRLENNNDQGAMKMTERFSIFVAYAQILVHLAGHPKPGLLWTDQHLAQGFAWAEGVVSFGVPDHDGPCLIEVQPFDTGALAARALWAVQVPFKVTQTLMIGSVFDMRPVTIPVGQYNLIFEVLAGRDDHAFVFHLKFAKTDKPDFAILKQGGALTSDVVLRELAELAGNDQHG